MLIIMVFSTYCTFFIKNYYENKTKKSIFKIVPKEVVVKTLTEIIQSEENVNFQNLHLIGKFQSKQTYYKI